MVLKVKMNFYLDAKSKGQNHLMVELALILIISSIRTYKILKKIVVFHDALTEHGINLYY